MATHLNYATIDDLHAQAARSKNIGNLLEIDKPAMQQEAAQNILEKPTLYHHVYVTMAKNIPKSGGSKKSRSNRYRRKSKSHRKSRKH